jgi:uncharacterized protein (DUF1800 family)
LLELHTLGVDGGYTQKDVTEVARCFTGWTIDQPQLGGEASASSAAARSGRKDRAGRADPGRRRQKDGERCSTSWRAIPPRALHFEKAGQRFVADDPPRRWWSAWRRPS